MVLAIDTINGRVPRNEMRHQLQPKKTNILAIYITARVFHPPNIIYKMECFTFISEYVLRKANYLRFLESYSNNYSL